MLEHLFGSTTRAKLLAIFFSHPDQAYFTREVTRKIRGHLTAVRRELENLTTFGILREAGVGRKKFYRVNVGFVLFPELKSVLFKAQVLIELDLMRRLNALGTMHAVVLTGFFAADDHSPTDIFIIGKLNRRRLARLLANIQRELDHPVRYTLMNKKEYEFRLDFADRFLYSILEGKKIVVYDKRQLIK